MNDSKTDIRKVVIIGSGPAGWTAALYTGRANLKPLVFEGSPPNTPGGQLMITNEVENFPGFPEGIMGPELMDNIKKQAVRFDVDVISENVTKVDLSSRPFTIEYGDKSVQAHSVIISTGANARLLGVDQEAELMSSGGGVSACATCDGAFYRNVPVVVVGGGDTAMEEASFLTRYASKVILVHRREGFRASQIMIDRVRNNEKIELQLGYVVNAYKTQKKPPMNNEQLVAVELKHAETGDLLEIPAEGCFIAIGHSPTTDLFKEQLDLDENGYLITEGKGSKTKIEGVFACGDVQDHTYRQAITAAGSGCMSAIDAERFLEANGL